MQILFVKLALNFKKDLQENQKQPPPSINFNGKISSEIFSKTVRSSYRTPRGSSFVNKLADLDLCLKSTAPATELLCKGRKRYGFP